jgi:molybdopterin converting factor small subunit
VRVQAEFLSLLAIALGEKQASLEVAPGTTAGDLARGLAARYGERVRGRIVGPKGDLRVIFSINGRAARADRVLEEGDIVLVMPPPAGG